MYKIRLFQVQCWKGVYWLIFFLSTIPRVHSEASKTSDRQIFAKILNNCKLLTIFQKISILNVLLDFEYASGILKEDIIEIPLNVFLKKFLSFTCFFLREIECYNHLNSWIIWIIEWLTPKTTLFSISCIL